MIASQKSPSAQLSSVFLYSVSQVFSMKNMRSAPKGIIIAQVFFRPALFIEAASRTSDHQCCVPTAPFTTGFNYV